MSLHCSGSGINKCPPPLTSELLPCATKMSWLVCVQSVPVAATDEAFTRRQTWVTFHHLSPSKAKGWVLIFSFPSSR